MKYPELFFAMDSCISCGQCQTVCPVTQVLGADKAPILDPLFPAFGSRWNVFTHLEASSYCTQCGRCQEVCPRGIPLPHVLAWVRAESGQQGKTVGAAEVMLDTLAATGNPWGRPISEKDRFAGGQSPGTVAPVLFYPGCATLDGHSATLEAWGVLARVLGIEYTTLGSERQCCGGLFYHWGRWEQFRDLAHSNLKRLRAFGSGVTVVSDCPHCVYTFRRLYSEVDPSRLVDAVYAGDYLAQVWPRESKETGETGDQSAVYLEPCFLRRLAQGERGDLRLLQRALPGSEVLGREHCCGVGEGMMEVEPRVPQELGAVVMDATEKLGGQRVVTGCPHCRRGLEKQGTLPVWDLLEVAARSLSP